MEGEGEEEKRRASGVDVVRYLDGDLEESDRSSVRYPAYLAGEKDYAQSEDAAKGGDDIVGMVITYIGDEDERCGDQHADKCGTLVICGGNAPPPVVAGVLGDAGGEKRDPGQYDSEKSA